MRIIFDEIDNNDQKQILDLIELQKTIKIRKQINDKQNKLKNDEHYE